VGTNIAGTTPLIGAALVALLRGGSELGTATLARFYAFHVLWLPLLLTVFVALHIIVVVRQGIAARPRDLEVGAPPKTKDPTYPSFYRAAYAASKRGGVRFWPDILGKDAIVSAAAVLSVVLLAVLFGAPLEAPADPTDTSYIPRPEWYFLPIYQLLKLVPGSMESVVAVGVPTALLFVLLGLPFFDRGSTRNLLHRPVALAGLLLLLGGAGFLIGAAGRTPAASMNETAALSSVQRAGHALYQSQQCAGCHRIAGQGGEEGPDLTTVGLRHSGGWIHSFVESPSRFHESSRMPAYGPPALSHQEIEELAQYLTTLRGRERAVVPQFYDTFPSPRRP
jgi:ubiquinol-cytochrome c reductase cytochrome b subunit